MSFVVVKRRVCCNALGSVGRGLPVSRMASDDAAHPPRHGHLIEVDGRLVHVLRQGAGMPVLLLHGNGSLGAEILSAFPDTAGVEWIAPDRPGCGLSAACPAGQDDPRRHARWLAALIDALDLGVVVVAAHSISAGAALWLAVDHPARVAGLVLLAPFCRPTQNRAMQGSPSAMTPETAGALRRAALPATLARLGRAGIAPAKAHDPASFFRVRLPVRQATRSRAAGTLTSGLRRFNDGMERLGLRAHLRVPVTAIFGDADRTADPAWHGPWLADRAPGLRVVMLSGVGHAVHHDAPAPVVRAVIDAVGRALPPDADPPTAPP